MHAYPLLGTEDTESGEFNGLLITRMVRACYVEIELTTLLPPGFRAADSYAYSTKLPALPTNYGILPDSIPTIAFFSIPISMKKSGSKVKITIWAKSKWAKTQEPSSLRLGTDCTPTNDCGKLFSFLSLDCVICRKSMIT